MRHMTHYSGNVTVTKHMDTIPTLVKIKKLQFLSIRKVCHRKMQILPLDFLSMLSNGTNAAKNNCCGILPSVNAIKIRFEYDLNQ